MPRILHQTDEQLELYSLGRLNEPLLGTVEEHLLVCPTCQERVDELEAFALAMRQAITDEPVAPPRTRWLTTSWLSGKWPIVAACAFAVLALVAVLYQQSGRNLPPLATLQLVAVRGDIASVESARETDITLTDAPADKGFRVEVVDAAGMKVADSLKITKPLSKGSYFVRLFDDSGKLLHEYGFRVSDPH